MAEIIDVNLICEYQRVTNNLKITDEQIFLSSYRLRLFRAALTSLWLFFYNVVIEVVLCVYVRLVNSFFLCFINF